MKKKKLFAIIMSILMIACFMPTMAFAEGNTTLTDANGIKILTDAKGIKYHILDETEKTVEVVHSELDDGRTCDSKYSGEVEIPATVKYGDTTYKVIGIGEAAFYNAKITNINLNEGLEYIESAAFGGSSLNSIEIPASVTRIGSPISGKSPVFASQGDGNAEIKSITFANNSQLTTIGSYAFANCGNIESLTIPANVTSIGEKAFLSCNSLENLNIPAGVTDGIIDALNGWANAKNVTFAAGSPFSNVGGVLYEGTTLVKALDKNIESVTVRESTRVIGEEAFNQCTKLKSVTLPEGLETIGDNAFYGCSALKKITLPDTVKSLGEEAFSGDPDSYDAGLEEIKLSASLKNIGESAFENTKLKTVVVPENVSGIPDRAFKYVTSLKTVVLCGNISSVGEFAFHGWKSGARW